MAREIFDDGGGSLVSKDQWLKTIRDLRAKTVPTTDADLDAALVSAVSARCQGKIALLLSGGVDSSLLAFLLKRHQAAVTAFCVGVAGGPDLPVAKKVADSIGIPLVSKVLSPAELDQIITKLKLVLATAIDNDQNLAVLYGVAAVEWAAIELAKENGFTVIMGGLGSEEIFAGYERHGKSTDINDECWNGLEGMWRRDLVRDSAIANALGIEVRTPLLDKDLIVVAMGLPGESKIVSGIKKACLRQAAIRLGLPKEFADRPKKAAQYGSGIDKAIEKLAKIHGFSRKGDFLKS